MRFTDAPSGKEPLYEFHIALECGKHQSRFAIFACRVDFNAFGRQQRIDHRVRVHADGAHESRIAAVDDRIGLMP